MTFQVVSPAPRQVWARLLDADPEALTTQTPAWLESICSTGRFEDASRLYNWEDGRQLLLPMVRTRAAPHVLATEASWPFSWGIGGIVAPGGVVTVPEAAAVFQDLARRPVLRTHLYPNPRASLVWSAAAPPSARTFEHMTQTIDLDGGFDRVWKQRFVGRVRTAVRKAERCNLDIERDSTGKLIPVFYDLYEQSVARWAQQQHEPVALARWRARRRHPQRKIEIVAERLQDACTIWVASSRSEAAAAVIILRHGAHAQYWLGAMNKDLAGPVRASYLLHRLAIEEASQSGCRYYHMGESHPGSSLAHFKRGFGAVEQRSYAYRIERLPLTAADNRVRTFVKRVLAFREV